MTRRIKDLKNYPMKWREVELSEIKQNKKGLWVVRFKIGQKWQKPFEFDTKNEAQYFLDNYVIHLKGRQKYPRAIKDASGKRLTDVMIFRLYEDMRTNCWRYKKLSGNTRNNHRNVLSTNIPDNLKKTLLSNIDESFIKACYDHKNNSSFPKLIFILKKLDKYARKNGYLGVTYDFDDHKASEYELDINEMDTERSHTYEDYKKIFHHHENPEFNLQQRVNSAIYALNIQLGLRVGELCALKWSSIDFKKGQIKVLNTMTKDEFGKSTPGDSTKTKKTRIVKFGESTRGLLKFIYFATSRMRTCCVYKIGKGWRVDVKQREFFGGKQVSRSFSNKKDAIEFKRKVMNFESDIESEMKVIKPIYLVHSVVTKDKGHISSQSLDCRYKAKGSFLNDIGVERLPTHCAWRKSMATITTIDLKKKNPHMTDIEIAKRVQKRLGHSSLSMTFDKYIVPSTGNDEGEFFDDIFSVNDETTSAELSKQDAQKQLDEIMAQAKELKKIINKNKKKPSS